MSDSDLQDAQHNAYDLLHPEKSSEGYDINCSAFCWSLNSAAAQERESGLGLQLEAARLILPFLSERR